MTTTATTGQKTRTTMESSFERIVGRPTTAEERQMLQNLRNDWGYNDDDPLIVVLALTGALTAVAQDIPAKIHSASSEIIELHAAVLRNQSNLIAKDLVGTIAGLIYDAGRTRRQRIIEAVLWAAAGASVSFGVVWFWLIKH